MSLTKKIANLALAANVATVERKLQAIERAQFDAPHGREFTQEPEGAGSYGPAPLRAAKADSCAPTMLAMTALGVRWSQPYPGPGRPLAASTADAAAHD